MKDKKHKAKKSFSGTSSKSADTLPPGAIVMPPMGVLRKSK